MWMTNMKLMAYAGKNLATCGVNTALRGMSSKAVPLMDNLEAGMEKYRSWAQESDLTIQEPSQVGTNSPMPKLVKHETTSQRTGSPRVRVEFDFGAKFKCHMKDKQVSRNSVEGMKGKNPMQPFEDVPFNGVAEYLGSMYLTVAEKDRKATRTRTKKMTKSVEAVPVPVPAFLPFTYFFSNTDAFKSTFIVDDDESKRRTRLSWYHPDDGMVPRGWFKDGLVADMKWYAPFSEKTGWQ